MSATGDTIAHTPPWTQNDENDAELALIQEALGHSNIATTMVYAHLSTAKRMRYLTKHLEGA